MFYHIIKSKSICTKMELYKLLLLKLLFCNNNINNNILLFFIIINNFNNFLYFNTFKYFYRYLINN